MESAEDHAKFREALLGLGTSLIQLASSDDAENLSETDLKISLAQECVKAAVAMQRLRRLHQNLAPPPAAPRDDPPRLSEIPGGLSEPAESK